MPIEDEGGRSAQTVLSSTEQHIGCCSARAELRLSLLRLLWAAVTK